MNRLRCEAPNANASGGLKCQCIAIIVTISSITFFAISYGWYVMNGNLSKSAFLERDVGHFERKFQMEGASPTNRCWCQKTRVIALSCGITIYQRYRQTDRQTDVSHVILTVYARHASPHVALKRGERTRISDAGIISFLNVLSTGRINWTVRQSVLLHSTAYRVDYNNSGWKMSLSLSNKLRRLIRSDPIRFLERPPPVIFRWD